MINNKTKAVFEIFILVSASFAFAYLLNEGFNDSVVVEKQKSRLDEIKETYKSLVELFFGGNLVSALSAQTCLKSKLGEICQQYTDVDCAARCDGECLPTKIENVPECLIGTCYNPVEGTCSAGSPKYACESQGGVWHSDKYANSVSECKVGCCILGANSEKTTLTTDGQCTKKAASLGVSKQFKSNIQDDLSCRALASIQPEGACVFTSAGKNTCKFIKENECTKLRGSFYLNTFCAKPELKTGCIQQSNTNCYDGKVYWYDSCGNRENVYEIPKAKSWNNGTVLTADKRCIVGSGNKNQCGNCDYFQGTKCGLKSVGESVDVGNYICKDLSCIDENGKRRDNGESWCSYQGTIGLDETKNRAADTPGSRHFRKSCIDGEIKNDPCADYRNEICVEERTNKNGGGTISTAACRTNLWQMCLEYNEGKDVYSDVQAAVGEETSTSSSRMSITGNAIGITGMASDDEDSSDAQAEFQAKQSKVRDLCEKNVDCFVKSVSISKDFSFLMCAPKYAPGFDTKDYGDSAEAICSLADQSCDVTFVKEAFSDEGIAEWVCKSNCECLEDGFAQKMNDLCMSMGDCGTKVNYVGALTDNAEIIKNEKAPINDHTPVLTSSYNSELENYAVVVPGQCAKPEWEGYRSVLGLENVAESVGYNATDPSDFGTEGMLIPGVIGIIGLAGVKFLGAAAASSSLFTVSGGTGTATFGTLAEAQAFAGSEGAGTISASGGAGASGALAGASGALAGAAIGFVVTSLLIKYTGIGAGLGEELTYTLIGLGTASGAVIGANAALTGTAAGAQAGAAGGLAGGLGGASGGLALAAAVAWVVIIVVIIVIIVFMLLGVGDTKTVTVKFSCDPWEAPTGGSQCGKCGEGKSCSRYQCHQLGQTCEFINEGTGNETCVNINPKDVSPPVISFLPGSTPIGFGYNAFGSGVKIEGSGSEKCAGAFSLMSFGVGLNEPGKCRMDTDGSKSYKDMSYTFGGSSLYRINHTMAFPVPSLESLGYPSVGENVRANITLYVKCMDYSGNKNENPYPINFCIKPGLDVTEPSITVREPPLGYTKFGVTLQNVTLLVSEPSNCKWDYDDKDYDSMPNEFSCKTTYDDLKVSVAGSGWPCKYEMPMSKNEEKYYVRCADQPWYAGKNESLRNKNSQSYQLILKRTATSVKIDSVNVENQTIWGGSSPVSTEVIVRTSGGYDGSAKCAYSFGTNYAEFASTYSSTSKQLFELVPGDKSISISCIDPVGNTDSRMVNFRIDVDKVAPKITRVYDSSGSLTVVTNENSQCKFVNSDNGCDLTNASLMTGTELTHSHSFDRTIPYFIGCEDSFGNRNDECVSVRGGIIS